MSKYTKIVLTEYEFNQLKKKLTHDIGDRVSRITTAIAFLAMTRTFGLTMEQIVKVDAEIQKISAGLMDGSMSIGDLQNQLEQCGIEYSYDGLREVK